MLFFLADDGTVDTELWRTDGTEAGTVLVKDISPPVPSNTFYYLNSFVELGGRLYFGVQDGTHGYELWRSDGTEAGTVLVKDIHPGPGSGLRTDTFARLRLYPYEGALYFGAADGFSGDAHGFEVWKTDGTEAGTVLVADVNPGPAGSDALTYVTSMAAFDGTLFFSADGGTNGLELWKLGVGTPTEPGAEADGLALRTAPNPTRGVVTLTLTLDAPQTLSVSVVDVLGREVARLHDGPLAAGPHDLSLDASRLTSGVYVVRVTAGTITLTQRLTVVR